MPDTATVTKTYRVNVENAKYALVSTNTASTYTIGTTKNLKGLMEADISFSLASGVLYGDGAIAENISQITGAAVTINLNKLDIDARAEIMGHAYTNGILEVSAGDTPPDIALYFEMPSSSGTKEQIWLLLGKAAPSNIAGTQRTENINFSTDSATINFRAIEKPNASGKKPVMRMMDTASSTVTTSSSAAFLAAPFPS